MEKFLQNPIADRPILSVRHTGHMGVWLISVQQSAKDVGVTQTGRDQFVSISSRNATFHIEIKTDLWYTFLVLRAPKYKTCCARSAIVGYNLF